MHAEIPNDRPRDGWAGAKRVRGARGLKNADRECAVYQHSTVESSREGERTVEFSRGRAERTVQFSRGRAEREKAEGTVRGRRGKTRGRDREGGEDVRRYNSRWYGRGAGGGTAHAEVRGRCMAAGASSEVPVVCVVQRVVCA